MLTRQTYWCSRHQFTAKEERRYDAHNNLIEIQHYSFDENNNKWDCWRTDKQTYNSKGKLATLETAHGENGLKKKAIYTWLDDTHSTSDVYACRSKTDSMGWVLEDKAEYTYNADGQILYEKYIWSYYLDKPSKSGVFQRIRSIRQSYLS